MSQHDKLYVEKFQGEEESPGESPNLFRIVEWLVVVAVGIAVAVFIVWLAR